jgi:hypothetical protein
MTIIITKDWFSKGFHLHCHFRQLVAYKALPLVLRCLLFHANNWNVMISVPGIRKYLSTSKILGWSTDGSMSSFMSQQHNGLKYVDIRHLSILISRENSFSSNWKQISCIIGQFRATYVSSCSKTDLGLYWSMFREECPINLPPHAMKKGWGGQFCRTNRPETAKRQRTKHQTRTIAIDYLGQMSGVLIIPYLRYLSIWWQWFSYSYLRMKYDTSSTRHAGGQLAA